MAAPNDTLLKLIPESELRRHLKSSADSIPPMYALQRCPVSINEFSECHRNTIVWVGNGTMFQLNSFPDYSRDHPNMNKPHIQLLFNHDSPKDMISFLIRGKSTTAVAETAAFLWGLNHERKDKPASIFIGSNHSRYEMNAFTSAQLERLFDVNPARRAVLFGSFPTANFAEVLSTRTYPLNLALEFSESEDGDTTFLSSLQHCRSSFGALSLMGSTLEEDTMRRLFAHLYLFEKLELPSIPQVSFLQALSAPIKSISLAVDFTKHDLSGIDFSSIDIVAEEVVLTIGVCDHVDYPTAFMVAFLQRVAQLGHFKALALRHDHPMFTKAVPEEVGKALVRALGANPKLKLLDLGREVFYSEKFWGPINPVDNYDHWDAHLKGLLHLMEDHAALEVFKIPTYPTEQDAEYSWLKQLLKRNRNIRVLDRFDEVVTDGAYIDQQYALNRFANCHVPLKGQPPLLRSALIGTALIECAAAHIPRTASLVLHHTDVLCDLLHDAEAIDTPAEQQSTDPVIPTVNIVTPSKRENETQLSPPASKRAHLF